MEGSVAYDRKRFTSRTFETSRAHIPPGGLGSFYASLDPKTGKMPVEVRVCPRFVAPGGGVVPDGVQAKFMDAFEDKVPEYWNGRFRFVCTKRGFEGVVVTPTFSVVKATLADAHYDLKIVNLATGAICVRTGEDPAVTASRDPKWDPYRGKLSAQFQMNAIEADTLSKSNNLLIALAKPVEIAYGTTPGQTGLSFAAIERLRTHARDVEHLLVGTTPAKMKLAITGPGKDGADIAKTIGKILEGFGFPGKLSYAKGGRPGFVTVAIDPSQIANARARIEGSIAQFPQLAQYAVVHEFGHMLGLPDEYMCCGGPTVAIMATRGLASTSANEDAALQGNTTTNQQDFTAGIAATQAALVTLCSDFGVPVPPFGRANQSLMSAGHTFLPAHAVTVAHALCRMTQNYFTAKDWRIEVLRA
jgi:hypothetical protein